MKTIAFLIGFLLIWGGETVLAVQIAGGCISALALGLILFKPKEDPSHLNTRKS